MRHGVGQFVGAAPELAAAATGSRITTARGATLLVHLMNCRCNRFCSPLEAIRGYAESLELLVSRPLWQARQLTVPHLCLNNLGVASTTRYWLLLAWMILSGISNECDSHSRKKIHDPDSASDRKTVAQHRQEYINWDDRFPHTEGKIAVRDARKGEMQPVSQ